MAERDVTLLLTDVERSTWHWRQHPDAMREAIGWHDAIVQRCVDELGGKVLTTHGEGDSMFAVFLQARDAVAAASGLQRELSDYRGTARLRVRIAIHTGPASEEDDYRGSTANRCARVRTYANGGEILLSGPAAAAVRNDLPEGTRLQDCGEWPLRDLGPERIFRLLYEGLEGDAQDRILPWISANQRVGLETLDQCLRDMDDRCQAVLRNLNDLHHRDSYVKLRTLSAAGRLAGPTRARVGAMLESDEELCANFRRIESVVTDAKRLRESVKLPQRLLPHRVDRLRDLLLGQSIGLPPREVPLWERDLLQTHQTGERLSPSGLLVAMARAFEAAKLVVQAVEEVWERFEPLIVEAERGVEDLRARTGPLGEATIAVEVEELAAALPSLHARVEEDPLGISDDLDYDVGPALDRLDSRLKEIEAERAAIRKGLDQGWELRYQLEHLQEAGRRALADSLREVRDPEGLWAPLDGSCLHHLDGWLAQLENRFADGDRHVVRAGLEVWLRDARATLEMARRIDEANRAPREERRLLKGRLKAEAERERRLEGGGEPGRCGRLAGLREELTELLRIPADLRRAREVFPGYEALLEDCLRQGDREEAAP